MRRSPFLCTLLVALLSAVCWAQRGGGHTGSCRMGSSFASHGGIRSFGGVQFSGQHHGGFHGPSFGHSPHHGGGFHGSGHAPHHGPVIVTHGHFGGHHFAHR